MDAAILVVVATMAGREPMTLISREKSMASCEEAARKMMQNNRRFKAWCRPVRDDDAGRPRG
jgi:hypothetical protein